MDLSDHQVFASSQHVLRSYGVTEQSSFRHFCQLDSDHVNHLQCRYQITCPFEKEEVFVALRKCDEGNRQSWYIHSTDNVTITSLVPNRDFRSVFLHSLGRRSRSTSRGRSFSLSSQLAGGGGPMGSPPSHHPMFNPPSSSHMRDRTGSISSFGGGPGHFGK